MGYDMHSVQATLEEEGECYSLNLWGMQCMREILARLGALNYEAAMPALPKWPGEEHFDEETGEAKTEQGRRYAEELKSWLAYRPPGDPRIPWWKFASNDGWLVTPKECLFLAERLGRVTEAIVREAVAKCASGLGQRSSLTTKEVRMWMDECRAFADFARKCAMLGGFEVY